MSNDIAPLTLGWTIVYVEDPVAASTFYADAFGLQPDFAAPDGSYAQMDTGQTKLAFASYGLAESNFPGGVARPDPARPGNVEVTLVSSDVDRATRAALEAGCTSLAEPVDKPHGQRVAYVRDPFGTLIEIGSPI
jgi:predicted enzyme related to lactoylglutathione lyase